MALKDKIVAITSPTHAMAMVLYCCAAIQGVFFFADISSARSIEELFGGRSLLFYVWAFGFAVSGALSFLAAYASKYFSVPNTILKVEMVGVVIIGLANLLYWISLYRTGLKTDLDNLPKWVAELPEHLFLLKGLAFAATTQLYAAGIFIGAIVRVAQIILDLRKLRVQVVQKVQDDYFAEG